MDDMLVHIVVPMFRKSKSPCSNAHSEVIQAWITVECVCNWKLVRNVWIEQWSQSQKCLFIKHPRTSSQQNRTLHISKSNKTFRRRSPVSRKPNLICIRTLATLHLINIPNDIYAKFIDAFCNIYSFACVRLRRHF